MEYFVELCYNLVRFSSIRIYDFNATFLKGSTFHMNYIKRMHIHGLKRFVDFDLKFNPKMNIIVGENEIGKSTILEALKVI